MSGTLLHICCAPCSIACIDTLRQEGIEPVGFWYNPNIHPMKEYKMRKNTLVEYAKSIDLKLEIENEYGLRKFIEAVYPNWDNRCATCYALRFEKTARYAAEHGYDRFTSTLFVSPYQNHELMRQICEQMAEKYGVTKTAMAVGWLTRIPMMIQVISGTTNPERMKQIIAGVNTQISREDWYAIYRAAGNRLP